MELIEVRALINDLNERKIPFNADINEAIITAPIVDAEPVRHGKWVKTGQSFINPNRFRNYSCSVCGYDIEKTEYNYCPNCGAKMRKEVNDD